MDNSPHTTRGVLNPEILYKISSILDIQTPITLASELSINISSDA
jgi:hypothetical protein